jgi:hypothetical protein
MVFAACCMMFAVSGTARADSCGDLVNQARSALQMQGLDESTRNDLESLLRDGRSGDPLRCDQATGSLFQSSPEGEKAPQKQHRCKESENTV